MLTRRIMRRKEYSENSGEWSFINGQRGMKMKILTKIEAAMLPEAVYSCANAMEASRPGGEVVIIEYNLSEMKTMQMDFAARIKEFKWTAENQEDFEKAELMHMIDIALRNPGRGNHKWFKDNARKILTDAIEFDQNSTKTLLVGKKVVYLVFAYNGRFAGGDGNVKVEEEGPDDVMDFSGN